MLCESNVGITVSRAVSMQSDIILLYFLQLFPQSIVLSCCDSEKCLLLSQASVDSSLGPYASDLVHGAG